MLKDLLEYLSILSLVGGYFGLSYLVGWAAVKYGRSRTNFFVASLLVTPLIGFVLLLAVASDDRAEDFRRGRMMRCPVCEEWIQAAAIKCYYCHEQITGGQAATSRPPAAAVGMASAPAVPLSRPAAPAPSPAAKASAPMPEAGAGSAPAAERPARQAPPAPSAPPAVAQAPVVAAERKPAAPKPQPAPATAGVSPGPVQAPPGATEAAELRPPPATAPPAPAPPAAAPPAAGPPPAAAPPAAGPPSVAQSPLPFEPPKPAPPQPAAAEPSSNGELVDKIARMRHQPENQHPPRFYEKVLDWLHHSDVAVRGEAVRFLGRHYRDRSDAQALLEMVVGDTSAEVRRAAADCLGGIFRSSSDHDANVVLANVAKNADEEPAVRAAAYGAIKRINGY